MILYYKLVCYQKKIEEVNEDISQWKNHYNKNTVNIYNRIKDQNFSKDYCNCMKKENLNIIIGYEKKILSICNSMAYNSENIKKYQIIKANVENIKKLIQNQKCFLIPLEDLIKLIKNFNIKFSLNDLEVYNLIKSHHLI